MVENWRVKMAISFSETFAPKPGIEIWISLGLARTDVVTICCRRRVETTASALLCLHLPAHQLTLSRSSRIGENRHGSNLLLFPISSPAGQQPDAEPSGSSASTPRARSSGLRPLPG